MNTNPEKPVNPWKEFIHPWLRNVNIVWMIIIIIAVIATIQGASAAILTEDLTDADNNNLSTGVIIGQSFMVSGTSNYTIDAIMLKVGHLGSTPPSDLVFGIYDGTTSSIGSLVAGYWYINRTIVTTTKTFYVLECLGACSDYEFLPNKLYWLRSTAIVGSGSSRFILSLSYTTGTYSGGLAYDGTYLTTSDSLFQINGTFATSPPTVNLISPVDNDHTNDVPLSFFYNVSSTGSGLNCSLYINNTLNETSSGLSNGTHTFNKSLSDGSYWWFVSCLDTNGETNSTNRTVVIDTISPDWTINPGNFFAADNSTTINPLVDGDTYAYDLTLQDSYIFAYNVTIFNSTGGIMAGLGVTNSSAEEVNITSTLNVSTWLSGNYTVELYAEDDHTAKRIPLYTTKYVNDGLEFITDKKTKITIRNEQGNLKSVTANKEIDRYTWDFEPNNNRKTWNFLVTSTEPLVDRSELWGYPGFVTGKHWVDFNVPEKGVIYNVEMIDSYNARITIMRQKITLEKLTMRSLGGLNIVNETYSFELLRTPVQSSNLSANSTGTDWIYLQWANDPTASGATLYRDLTPISTTTGTSFNDTNLSSGASYNYLVRAFYNESGTLIYNTSTSGTNAITAQTIFNGTLAVEVRNAVSDSLITGDLFYINLIGNLANQTVTTNTGLAALNNITTDNYTVRVTGVGWGSRDLYTTIQQNQSENVIARLLNDTVRTGGVITVRNTAGEEQDGVIVKLLRYLPGTNSYENVQSITTASTGLNTMDAQLYDAYYKFVVESDGITYFTSSGPETLYPDVGGLWRRTFTIGRGADYFTSWQNSVGLNYTFTNSTTGNATTFTLTWNDPTNLVNQGCIDTRQYLTSSWADWQRTCGAGSAGSVFVTLNKTNAYRYQYAAIIDYSTSYREVAVAAGYTNPTPIYNFGALGAFLGAIMIGGLALLFSYSAAAMMVVGGIGIALMSALSFLPMTGVFILGGGFLVVALVVYLMRS